MRENKYERKLRRVSVRANALSRRQLPLPQSVSLKRIVSFSSFFPHAFSNFLFSYALIVCSTHSFCLTRTDNLSCSLFFDPPFFPLRNRIFHSILSISMHNLHLDGKSLLLVFIFSFRLFYSQFTQV